MNAFKNLKIIGLGKMGLSIAQGLFVRAEYPSKIFGIVRSEEKAEKLRKTEFFPISAQLEIAPDDAVLIAVKPAQFTELKPLLSPLLSAKNLVISVMAGISISGLRSMDPDVQLIRMMPNTGSSIRESASVFFASENVSENSILFARSLFQKIGISVQVNCEELVDACTAICGSGIAYAFYLAEQMLASAIEFGMNEKEADLLVRQTFVGAGLLMKNSPESIQTLRKNVTSPKGTTQAATDFFDQNSMGGIVRGGCQKAFSRAKELAKIT